MCGGEVPPERVKFLLSEGRSVVCIDCQRALEEEGAYRTYRGVIVTDGEGRYYDFDITTEDLSADPFEVYRVRRWGENENL